MLYLAYVIFVPIAKELAPRLNNPPISTATALALGAVASFNLVYPFPVIISAAEELLRNKDTLILLVFLITVLTSTAGYLYVRDLKKTETSISSGNDNLGDAQPGFAQDEFQKLRNLYKRRRKEWYRSKVSGCREKIEYKEKSRYREEMKCGGSRVLTMLVSPSLLLPLV